MKPAVNLEDYDSETNDYEEIEESTKLISKNGDTGSKINRNQNYSQ